MTTTATCIHWWRLDPPAGTISRGRCKRCGAERAFRNSSVESIWDSESPLRAVSRKAEQAAATPVNDVRW
jgi:hypothetical protein